MAESTRARAIAAARDRHRGRLRLLICEPPSLAAQVWSRDLAAGARHMGLEVRLIGEGDRVTDELLQTLHPEVVILLDGPDLERRVDLEALARHKRRRGCLRLFVPFDAAGGAGAALEERRIDLYRRGLGPDAACSLFEAEYYARHHRRLQEAGVPYVPLPQSGNPLEDAPVAAARTRDWFYASVGTPERLEASWEALPPILRRSRGDWAGSHWGFGGSPVPFAAMPARYAAARVVLSPLLPRLMAEPLELTHRVFEAAACGAFQISTISPVTRRFFSERALVCAEHNKDYSRVFFEWLPRREERARAAEQALIELYAAHTVFHRIDALLAAIQAMSGRF